MRRGPANAPTSDTKQVTSIEARSIDERARKEAEDERNRKREREREEGGQTPWQCRASRHNLADRRDASTCASASR